MDGRNHPRHPFPPFVILIEDEHLITNPQGLDSFVPSFALDETRDILFHPPWPKLVDDELWPKLNVESDRRKPRHNLALGEDEDRQ